MVAVASQGNGQACYIAVTANGDVYTTCDAHIGWQQGMNVFGSGPTPAVQETWGGVKAKYRQPGAATQDK